MFGCHYASKARFYSHNWYLPLRTWLCFVVSSTFDIKVHFFLSCGRIFVLHVPGLSELEGIEFSSLTGKLSPETFDNVSDRRCLANP